jgi:hypothetical protein
VGIEISEFFEANENVVAARIWADVIDNLFRRIGERPDLDVLNAGIA